MAITVSIPRGVLRKWERDCKAAFPQEFYGILIGRDRGRRSRTVTVNVIYVPEDWGAHSSPNHVDPRDVWFAEAREAAREAGLDLIGDAHSHPYKYYEPELSPSNEDFKVFTWSRVALITNVCLCTRKAGGKFETYLKAKTAAFPPLIRTDLKVV